VRRFVRTRIERARPLDRLKITPRFVRVELVMMAWPIADTNLRLSQIRFWRDWQVIFENHSPRMKSVQLTRVEIDQNLNAMKVRHPPMSSPIFGLRISNQKVMRHVRRLKTIRSWVPILFSISESNASEDSHARLWGDAGGWYLLDRLR